MTPEKRAIVVMALAVGLWAGCNRVGQQGGRRHALQEGPGFEAGME